MSEQSERKLVTVLFADLTGSKALRKHASCSEVPQGRHPGEKGLLERMRAAFR